MLKGERIQSVFLKKLIYCLLHESSLFCREQHNLSTESAIPAIPTAHRVNNEITRK